MVHSVGDCGFRRGDGLITQRKTEAGNIKQKHKGYNIVIFKCGVRKSFSTAASTKQCAAAKVLEYLHVWHVAPV